MRTATRTGRIIGLLLALQMLGGGAVNFGLEAPLFGTPGFLVAAASHSQQIGVGALLGLATEALWLGVALTAFTLVYQRSRPMAVWLVALAAVCLAGAIIENAGVMSMVSVSQAYAKASAVERQQLETVRVVIASARNWAHFTARMIDGITIFAFCVVLYRFRLVPRVLAGFGLFAAVLQVASIAMPFFGGDIVFPLLAPLGLSQLLLVLWLMTKGFPTQPGASVEPRAA